MSEIWHVKKKKWMPVDSVRLALLPKDTDMGIRRAREFINPKTRELRLRFRTKKETADPYYLKIDCVHLVGIRKEGLKDYGDLFSVDVGNDKDKSEFAKKLKQLKDDWDLSFNKGGRIIPIKDWETTEERKEKLKDDWRKAWTNHGKVVSFEDQMRTPTPSQPKKRQQPKYGSKK